MVKNPTAKAGDQGTQIRSKGWDDPLEKEMTTHSNILTWKIPRTEEPGGLQSMGPQELDMTELLSTHSTSAKPNTVQIQNIGK